MNAKQKTALLVIDMIKEYLHHEGKMYCGECRRIIPGIQKLIFHAHRRLWPVFYVNTALEKESEPLAKKWGMHAIRDTWGSNLIDELSLESGDIIVNKKTYDGFYDTTLHDSLKKHDIDKVFICGIHTHVCVLLTALGAFYRGYEVIIPEDCITTDKKINHETRLPFFKAHVGKLTSLDKLIAEDD